MPNWTPGSYVIRDYSANLERLSASGSEGQDLKVEKTAKNRWKIQTGGNQLIVIDYDIWAGELHVSSSWVESEFALINGASVFLFSEESLDWNQQVSLVLPAGWSRSHSSLATEDSSGVYLARDYHELVDSPIVAGKMTNERFELDGQGYSLVNVGETEFWDNSRAVADLTCFSISCWVRRVVWSMITVPS